MSFANPWAWWLAAAAVPLFAAFLIRRWRRQRVVSSVVVFRLLEAQTASRQRLARPHHLVALLLSLLAMAALVMAALEPEGVEVQPKKYVVLFDTSASMASRELATEANRFTRGVTKLATFLDRLNDDDEVALVTFGPEAHLETGWTRDHAEVLRLVADRVPAGHGGGSLDAFRVADAMCQDVGSTEIVLVSDGANLAIPPIACPLRYVRVGQPASNVAVTGLTVREADALGLNEIYLAVHNGSDSSREVTVELDLDGAVIDVTTETIDAGTTAERLIRLPLGDGEILSARAAVQGEDALSQDDVAYAVMRPGAPVKTLLLTRYPTTFLAEALRLHPRVDLTVSPPEGLDHDAGPFDLMVIDADYTGALPQADHVVVLDADTELLGLPFDGTVNDPEIIRWSFDDPLFRFVNLDGVHIQSATATQLPPGAVSLMDMPDGPLIFSLDDGGRQMLYFTFHPDRSDLPLRVAFVNLVANLVEWAEPAGAGALATGLSTGQRLSDTAPGLTLQPVAGGRAGQGSFPATEPVERPGVYRVVSADGTERGLIAANLFSVEESEISPQNRLGVGAMQGWPEIQRSEPFPWWILALSAVALLVLEWLLPGLLGLTYRSRRRRGERAARQAATGPMNSSTERGADVARAASS